MSMEVYCVKTKDKSEREEFINYLEKKGFIIDESHFSKQDILCSILPIIVNLSKKTINVMGNITVAACAAQCGRIITQEDFFKAVKL